MFLKWGLKNLISDVGVLGFIRFPFPPEGSRSGLSQEALVFVFLLILVSFLNPADFQEKNK